MLFKIFGNKYGRVPSAEKVSNLYFGETSFLVSNRVISTVITNHGEGFNELNFGLFLVHARFLDGLFDELSFSSDLGDEVRVTL
jgi:hypothetical protein